MSMMTANVKLLGGNSNKFKLISFNVLPSPSSLTNCAWETYFEILFELYLDLIILFIKKTFSYITLIFLDSGKRRVALKL